MSDITEPQTERELLLAIYNRQTEVIEDVKRLKEAYHGNGKAGLCERVTVMETTLKVIGGILVVMAGWVSFK